MRHLVRPARAVLEDRLERRLVGPQLQVALAHRREVVDDRSQLQSIHRLDNIRDAKFDFLYELATFLQKPIVSIFLIMIGITCLILELKMPGVSLPGVIAAICFVLYFWAQSRQLSGQIITLAILLFILGQLFFQPPDPTACAGAGVTTAAISGAISLGSPQ